MIRNKDGSIYVIQKPNPIMHNQQFWDDSILHNFSYKYATTYTTEQEPTEEIPIRKPNLAKISVHCLPANIVEHRDPIYNETKITIQYEQKTILEVIPVVTDDIHLQVWTQISLGNKSIIFVPSDRRWWQVVNSEAKHGGFIVDCVPSDITPAFQ